jgi:hypothetical protein
LLVHPDRPCNLGQALISLVTCFIHHVHVEKFLLVLEQGVTEFPEFLGSQLEDCCACFVRESGRWVPGLDLLPEDYLKPRAVLLGNCGTPA